MKKKLPANEIVWKGKEKLTKFLSIDSSSINRNLKTNFIDLFFLNLRFLNVYKIETHFDPTSDFCHSYTTKDFDTNA